MVRFAAIRLTLSVRSFHVPATPFTTAWPPSLPSVPTSRATRVTSDENVPSCATMVFTTLAVRRNSPVSGRSSISSDIVCVRSPLATAPMTRATSVVGCTRSETSVLTDSTAVLHAPSAEGSCARCLTLPALPTTRAQALELFDEPLVALDGRVERVANLSGQARAIVGHADREVAALVVGEHAVQHPEVQRVGSGRRRSSTRALCFRRPFGPSAYG